MRASESGASLIEATVAVGILAVVVGATLNAASLAIHRFGPDPYQAALERATLQEARIAADILKYDGTSLTPQSIATSVPLPSASPLPVHMSLMTTGLPDGSVTIVVQTSSNSPSRSATERLTLAQRAPAPGARILVPGTVPGPTGAP